MTEADLIRLLSERFHGNFADETARRVRDAQSRIRSGSLTHSHGVEFVGRNVRLAQQFVDEHADLAGVVAPLVALAQRQQFAVLGDAHGTDVRSGLNSKY